jgi:hypothetical protein
MKYLITVEDRKRKNAEKQRRNRAKAKLLGELVDGIEDRFWSRVNKTEVCWEWTANLHCGYGRIVYLCQELESHRVSWKLAYGAIPDGLWVLHKCDNRKCVRPDHLFLGTVVDNVKDRDSKGRQATGLKILANRPNLKLRPDDVRAIRLRVDAGEGNAPIAYEYGVSPNQIRRIYRRERWAFV